VARHNDEASAFAHLRSFGLGLPEGYEDSVGLGRLLDAAAGLA
jgi:hypothetical protein